MDAQPQAVPDHVPLHLVYDYDRYESPALYEAPQFSMARKLREEAPPIFYTPRQNMWVVTKSSLVADMLRRHDLFSSEPEYCLWRQGHAVRVLPPSYDPPEVTDARKVVAPLFTPLSVKRMEPAIRQLARDIIDDVVNQGHCEFVAEIGKLFPVTVFMMLANAPLDLRETLIDAVERYLRSPRLEDSLAGQRDLVDHLSALIDERRAKPGDDLISRILAGEMFGRPLTHDEVLGATYFMFLAGLDTVASVFSFMMRFLARNPDHYAQLVAEPARIDDALEELLRVSGVAMPERAAKSDFDYEGVPFRKHDHVLLLSSLSGMDPEEVDQPEIVSFERDVSKHAIFGIGAHRCLGSHLARMEMKIFLEEWVRRIPAFRIEGEVKVLGGIVWIPAALPLAWDPAIVSSAA